MPPYSLVRAGAYGPAESESDFNHHLVHVYKEVVLVQVSEQQNEEIRWQKNEK